MTRRLLAIPLLLFTLTLAACGGGGSSTASQPSAGAGAPSGAVAPSKPLSGPVADAPSPLGAWPGFAREGRHGGSAAVVGPQSAHVLWKRALGGPVVPGPAIGKGGVVYAAANDGVLHAIDLRDGHDRWSFDGGAAYGKDLSTVPALLADGTVVWPGPEESVFGLSPSGKLLWRVKLASQPLSPVVLPDGSIVVGDQSGDVEDLVPRPSGSPTVRWHVGLGGTSYSSPALGPGRDRLHRDRQDAGGDPRRPRALALRRCLRKRGLAGRRARRDRRLRHQRQRVRDLLRRQGTVASRQWHPDLLFADRHQGRPRLLRG